jgi:hypothetical protein
VNQKSETGGKGGEERCRGGRNQIEEVGEVGGSPTRLSMVARIERGGAAVRGRRGGPSRSWKGRRGAPARGGARGGDGRAEGGRRRQRSVDWGAAVSVGTT